MKRSSIINLAIVAIVFVAVQGWVIKAKFYHFTLKTSHAYITGRSVAVGTAVSGIIKSVNVTEGKYVEKGQPLFLISRQSPQEPNGEEPVAIVAQQSGTVYNIEANVNTFVQASQVLAHIVDSSPEALSVFATLSLTPEQFAAIAPSQQATVQGSLFNNGEPITSVITSVSLYDGSTGTVELRLRMLEQPSIPNISAILKLPVEVTLLDEKQDVPNTSSADSHST